MATTSASKSASCRPITLMGKLQGNLSGDSVSGSFAEFIALRHGPPHRARGSVADRLPVDVGDGRHAAQRGGQPDFVRAAAGGIR